MLLCIHCTGLLQLFTNWLYTGPALCTDTSYTISKSTQTGHCHSRRWSRFHMQNKQYRLRQRYTIQQTMRLRIRPLRAIPPTPKLCRKYLPSYAEMRQTIYNIMKISEEKTRGILVNSTINKFHSVSQKITTPKLLNYKLPGHLLK